MDSNIVSTCVQSGDIEADLTEGQTCEFPTLDLICLEANNENYLDHEIVTAVPYSRRIRFESGRLKEATLTWHNLEKHVEVDDCGVKREKQILFKVSGVAKPTEMVAMMGPSGSGKTTLLNILGGRSHYKLKGELYMNGEPFNKSMRRSIAYVLQDDIFYMQLTVRQQLAITANLRLPDYVSSQDKKAAVSQVIASLRLDTCADTPILLLSGGERKRCNIGTEMLTNPCVLLLDEPTSGLDSTAAHCLMDTLRSLAQDRMTIISSIHQPSSRVFYSFDRLLLLADGCTVYSGKPQNCTAYFSKLKYCPPMDYNPADFIMDLVNSTGQSDSETESVKSIRAHLIDSWDRECSIKASKEDSIHVECSSDDDIFHAETFDICIDDSAIQQYPSSYWTQFITLLGRAMLVSKTSSMTTLQVSQTILLAVISGLCWFDMAYEERRVIDRAGFLFSFMTFWFFLTLFQGLSQFLPERIIVLKERASGSYRLSAYYFSKTLSELPVRLAMPFLFLLISFPMASLFSAMSPSVVVFIGVVGVQLLAALAGESIGLFIGTTTMDFEKAAVTATLTSTALMLTGGYFVQNLPEFMSWIKYLSPFKYSYDACLKLVFDRSIPCNGGDILYECSYSKHVPPEAALKFLGQTGSIEFNVGMLLLFIFVFRLGAYMALRFIPHNNGRK